MSFQLCPSCDKLASMTLKLQPPSPFNRSPLHKNQTPLSPSSHSCSPCYSCFVLTISRPPRKNRHTLQLYSSEDTWGPTLLHSRKHVDFIIDLRKGALNNSLTVRINCLVHGRRGIKRDAVSGKDSTYKQSSRRGGTPWRRWLGTWCLSPRSLWKEGWRKYKLLIREKNC